MCYRPVSIRNHKLCKNTLFDKSLIEVPCGHCIECKQDRQLSWFIRYYYEWKYCISKGGFAYFLTLTYNEDSIPRFFPSFDFQELKKFGFRHTQGLRCFSKRDIQLYLKRIRKALFVAYPNYDMKGILKYAVTCEMGGLTHRPHYHVLFFVSSPFIRSWHFRDLVKRLWSEDSKYCKKKGFVKEGKLNNGFVVSGAGLSYCSKYVTKDIFDETWFNKVKDILVRNGVPSDVISSCFPHNMQSQGLGLYALEYDELNDLDTFFKGNIILPDKELGTRTYKLPLYLDRKLFYTTKYRFYDTNINDYILVDSLSSVPVYYDYSPVYVLNELGLEMKDVRLQKAIDAASNVYNVVQGLPENKEILLKINEKFKTNFDSLRLVKSYIKENLPEDVFVSYGLVYRGCVTPPGYNNCVCDFINSRVDYNLLQLMSSGHNIKGSDFDLLCSHIDFYNSLPLIEDYYQLIRYIFKVVHLQKEKMFLQRELDYVHQKSSFLRRTENV